MAYAVELNLEGRAEAAVRGIWAALRDGGITSTMPDLGARPHLTLAVYEDAPEDALRDQIESFFAAEEPLELTLAAVGMFPGSEGVVFLAPVVTPELLGLHARFHHRFDHLADGAWAYYRPGVWVPHCTIALNVPEGKRGHVAEIAVAAPLPIQAMLSHAGVITFAAGSEEPIVHLFEAALRA